MSKKEEASKYASTKFVGKEKILGANFADYESIFNKKDIAKAYQAGWDEALKWINVKDKLPSTGEVVLVLTSNGKVSTTKRYQPKDCRGKDIGLVTWKGSTTFVNSIIAWMPIPSFDEILEANKDVLGRLKGE